MAKIYWTKEVKKLMDNEIHELLDNLINDTDITLETENEMVAMIRTCRQFADKIISQMTELDRQEDEERAQREQKEGGQT